MHYSDKQGWCSSSQCDAAHHNPFVLGRTVLNEVRKHIVYIMYNLFSFAEGYIVVPAPDGILISPFTC